jgi:hypothetical protein
MHVQAMLNVVYWTEYHHDVETDQVSTSAESRTFDNLGEMVKFCQSLHQARESGEKAISHICSTCENPDNVGLRGVGDAPANYDWVKRRSKLLRKDLLKVTE